MGDLKLPDLNQVIIAGRLTRDPELKYTTGGQAYCKLGLANSRYYKDKNGQRQEVTTFADATVWGPHAEFVGKYMRKGLAVLVEARLQTDEWEDRQSGQKRSRLTLTANRVTSLEWDSDRSGGSGGGSAPRPAHAEHEPTPPPPMDEPVPEDDIPF